MMLKFRRVVASLLMVCIGGLGLPLPAQAGMLGTDAALAASQRDHVASLFDRADVKAQLEAYGINTADVKARVAAMTDEEVGQLAGKIDSLPAGGDGIIGALVLVFIVLLITDILGFTKIFPFTRPIR